MDLMTMIKNQIWPARPPTQSELDTAQAKKLRRAELRMNRRKITNAKLYKLRTSILDDKITIFSWPSRGGMIVLERANAVHFDVLGISRIDPPLYRANTPEEEDKFCQALLRLGATWYDSADRWGIKCNLADGDPQTINDLEHDKFEPLTLTERLWVEVAWVESAPGNAPEAGFWVGEWDTTLPGILLDDIVPMEVGQLSLAVNMTERQQMLERLGGKFYQSIADYHGPACFKAWDTKWQGEVEKLEQSWPAM